MGKKRSRTGHDAPVIENVLKEVSEERRRIHADLDKASEELVAKQSTWNAKLISLDQTFSQAKADLTGLERLRPHLVTQEYDEEKHALEKARAKTEETFTDAREAAQKELNRLRKPVDEFSRKAADLAREWEYHARHARAASVKLERYWTPEKGVMEVEA